MRLQGGLGHHPRSAYADHVGQREIRRGFGQIDAAGGAEYQIGQGGRDRREQFRAADRFGGKQFQGAKSPLPQRHRLGGGRDAREERNGRFRGGFRQPR